MSTWLITGCSTGLGRALAEAVLDRGDNAVVTARDAAGVQDLADAHPDTALALALDVTDHGRVVEVVEQAQQRFGAVAATKAVLPGMRARRSGAIVNISSIGARIMPAGSGYYSATKAALEGLTGSLRKEVEPLGITAMVVEPGAFRTDFSGRSLQQSAEAISDYADTAGRRRKEHDTTHGTQPGDPAKAAQAIIRAVKFAEPPALLVLGQDAVDGFRGVLDTERAELEAWESTSVDMEFDA